MARALVIFISTLLILLLLAAGSAWYLLHDETFLKRQLEDAVQRETGRALSIDGALVAEVGESIRVSAAGVKFADAPWARRDSMFEAGRISAQVDTRSLFSERLEIESVSLSDCRLTLETATTGERNWHFSEETRRNDRDDKTLAGFPRVLERLDLENCRLEHRAPERSEPLHLTIATLALQSDEQGQYSGHADGVVNDTAFGFSGRFGPPKALWQGGAFVQDIDLQLGEITLNSSGSFADARSGEGARLSLRFSGPEFLQVAGYLNLPPLSSGPFDATAHIDTTQQATRLHIDGDLGTLEVKAEGEMDRLRQPQRGKISFEAKGPDLQALAKVFGVDGVVQDSFRLLAEATFDDGKAQVFPLKLDTPRDSLEVDGTLGSLADFSGSDLRFKASSQDLDRWARAWGGRRTGAGAVNLEGEVLIEADRLRLEDMRILALGDRARVSGTVPFREKLAGSRLDVQVQLASVARTGSLLGLANLPDLPLVVAGPLEVQATRIRSPGLEFESGATRGEVSGDMPRSAPLSDFTLSWRTSGDDLARFYAVPGLADWPQDFDSSGSWSRKGSTDHLEGLTLRLGSLDLAVTGNLDGPSGSRQMDLQVRAALPDASELDSLWKRSFPPQALEVVTAMTGSWQDLKLSALSASLGSMKIGGELRFQREPASGSGRQNRISGGLSSDYLDVSRWLEESLASGQQQSAAPEGKASKSPRVFGDHPVTGFSKSPVALDLDISIGSLDLGNSNLENVRLGLLWTDEELRLDRVSLSGAEGSDLSGFFAIDGRPDLPRLELRFRGKDIKLGLGALEKQDPSTYPPLELVLDLQGAGKTVHELVVSLEGKIRMYQGAGLFGSARTGILFNDFISELFNLLNPFARQSEYSRLDCSVWAADLNAGSMTITPVIIQTPELTILSEGTIDLVTEQIDMTFNTKPRKGVGISAGMIINPFLKVGGQLSDPAIELDPKGAVISGGTAVATVGLSLVFKTFADRFFSSRNPCGDARKTLAELDAGG